MVARRTVVAPEPRKEAAINKDKRKAQVERWLPKAKDAPGKKGGDG